MSIPHVSRQPLLRMVPADMEDEVLARFFQRSCSLADLAEFTGCTIRAISKWFEREDVQADLQRIARFAQGRTGYLLQESTHLIMQNHEHLMGLLGSDKFHYANSTTQARMMETARKAGNDLNKLRQDLDPNRPTSTSRAESTSRADFTSRELKTSRDRQGAGELANTHNPTQRAPAPLPDAHHETRQLDPSPATSRPEPAERSSPIPQFKPAPIPDQHIASFSPNTPVPLHRGPSTTDQLDDLTPARAVPDATPAHDLAGTTEPTNPPASTRNPSPEPRNPTLPPDNSPPTRDPSPEPRDPASPPRTPPPKLDSPSTPSNPSVLHSEADRTDPSERGVSAGEPLVSTDQSRPP